MPWESVISSKTIEELEYEVARAQVGPKTLNLEEFFCGLRHLSQEYAQKVYDEIGNSGLPRDEIEGSGRGPGFGHVVWAVALIATAWTSWLFPDKGLRRFDGPTSQKYGQLVTSSVKQAIGTGSDYVGKDRSPMSVACKWVEVNIHLSDYSATDAVLKQFVWPYVQACKARGAIYSWHFFREPEIRLRFYGKEPEINIIKQDLDSTLSQLEAGQPEIFHHHLFGSHGKDGEEYPGEADTWGGDWPIAMRVYENGAETALRFLTSERHDKPLEHHADRYVHLLLNQLGYTRFHELLFHGQKAGGYLAEFVARLLQETGEIKNRLGAIEKAIGHKPPEDTSP
jgi:hypothetical protein